MLSEHVDACDEPFYPLYSPEIKKEDAVCLVESEGLGSQMVRDISNGLITSGLVGENAWSNHFAGTRGFGVKFRREALDTLIKLMPWTRPYFDKILDENVARHFCADRSEKSQPNAFYLNALVIPPGKGTGLHVDKTLDVNDTDLGERSVSRNHHLTRRVAVSNRKELASRLGKSAPGDDRAF